MATITAHYNRSVLQRSNGKRPVPGQANTDRSSGVWSDKSPMRFVLGMAGYFLILGSIAVVVLGNQFPWFMAAPITILLAAAYFRHGDAKPAHERSRHLRV